MQTTAAAAVHGAGKVMAHLAHCGLMGKQQRLQTVQPLTRLLASAMAYDPTCLHSMCNTIPQQSTAMAISAYKG